MTISKEKKHISEKMSGLRGRVTFSNFVIGCKEAERIEKILSNSVDMPEEKFNRYISRLRDLCEVREQTFDNQIVSVGRQVFARLLNADTTYSGAVNYGALGTGSTAVSDADTVLDTEVKRKGIATKSRSLTTSNFRFFYSKSDTNGTYQEFGTFIDGTASVDTGQMFNRVLTGGWTKSALEAMTVTVQFDINPQ